MRINSKTCKALRRATEVRHTEVEHVRKTHMVKVFVPGIKMEDLKALGRVFPMLEKITNKLVGYMYPVASPITHRPGSPRSAYRALKRVFKRSHNRPEFNARLANVIYDEKAAATKAKFDAILANKAAA